MRLSRVAFGPRGAAYLIAILASVPAATARADTTTLATEPGGASSVVLWKEGAAWWGGGGIRFATAGSASRLLAPFPELGGLAYYRALDGGAGAGGTGALVYGWNEVNEQTPPMGPGDTEVPSPPIPYESNVLRRGVIAADGTATELPDCGVAYAFGTPNQEISLSGSTFAYACGESPLPGKNPSTYLTLASGAAPGTTQSKVGGVNGIFQLSGDFVAYDSGEPSKAGRVIVRDLATNTAAYEFPQALNPDGEALALQEDGSLVVLGQGTSSCPVRNEVRLQTSPAEWFPISSPVAHQLGCFYDGAVRPVDGKWIALAPGPGSEASLVLVDLDSGSQMTLAVFPSPGMIEPQQKPIAPAADFDGTRLAWTLETCAGIAVQLTPDIHAMSPGARSRTRVRCSFTSTAGFTRGRGETFACRCRVHSGAGTCS